MPTVRNASWAAGILVACLTAATTRGGEPGIVKEKPADGVRSVQIDGGWMVPYTVTIPGSDVSFDMVPVPGGRFRMGSPDSEKGRAAAEGPQVEIEVEPRWVGQHEVTWAEYHRFMEAYKILISPETPTVRPSAANEADAVSTPTPLYDARYAYEKGEDPRQPAVAMTQFAVRQYTKWISKITGQFYRLPTEAEWEHAARAGTTTVYFFGDDPAALGDYAWFAGNSKTDGAETEITHPVGLKKPNPWGLYDVYGNAAEWTLDEFAADHYGRLGPGPTPWDRAVRWPVDMDPRVLRGGSFRRDAAALRSAARWKSDTKSWRRDDPQRPRSPWWLAQEPLDYTELEKGGQEAGFRLVRPLRRPDPAMLTRYWEADVPTIRNELEPKLSDKGGLGLFEPGTGKPTRVAPAK